jgi:hypothetical protein
MKATTEALSFDEASRLSKATKGAVVAVPGVGSRLAGVSVTRVKVPAERSVNGSSTPEERSAFGFATCGIK